MTEPAQHADIVRRSLLCLLCEESYYCPIHDPEMYPPRSDEDEQSDGEVAP